MRQWLSDRKAGIEVIPNPNDVSSVLRPSIGRVQLQGRAAVERMVKQAHADDALRRRTVASEHVAAGLAASAAAAAAAPVAATVDHGDWIRGEHRKPRGNKAIQLVVDGEEITPAELTAKIKTLDTPFGFAQERTGRKSITFRRLSTEFDGPRSSTQGCATIFTRRRVVQKTDFPACITVFEREPVPRKNRTEAQEAEHKTADVDIDAIIEGFHKDELAQDHHLAYSGCVPAVACCVRAACCVLCAGP